MARRDLTNAEVEQMGLEEPGSAAEYLRLRREELAAEEQERREEDDKERYVERFVAAGGERPAAKTAYKAHRNEIARIGAVLRADEAASEYVRRGISGAL